MRLAQSASVYIRHAVLLFDRCFTRRQLSEILASALSMIGSAYILCPDSNVT